MQVFHADRIPKISYTQSLGKGLGVDRWQHEEDDSGPIHPDESIAWPKTTHGSEGSRSDSSLRLCQT